MICIVDPATPDVRIYLQGLGGKETHEAIHDFVWSGQVRTSPTARNDYNGKSPTVWSRP